MGCEHPKLVARLWKESGINVNDRDIGGKSAESWAAVSGAVECLHVLLEEQGIDLNLADKTGRSPLPWAAGLGQPATVSALLADHRVDKASVDRTGRGAISWACACSRVPDAVAGGCEASLRALIQAECPDVDRADDEGWTPLTWLVEKYIGDADADAEYLEWNVRWYRQVVLRLEIRHG